MGEATRLEIEPPTTTLKGEMGEGGENKQEVLESHRTQEQTRMRRGGGEAKGKEGEGFCIIKSVVT